MWSMVLHVGLDRGLGDRSRPELRSAGFPPTVPTPPKYGKLLGRRFPYTLQKRRGSGILTCVVA
jgi:hypothetical protein